MVTGIQNVSKAKHLVTGIQNVSKATTGIQNVSKAYQETRHDTARTSYVVTRVPTVQRQGAKPGQRQRQNQNQN